MADAKIEIKVAGFTFTGEGTEKWLSGELDKLLTKLPELVEVAPSEPAGGGEDEPTKPAKKGNVGTLAHFLQQKNASTNQRKKFLATAVWLHDKSGELRLTTGQIKKALRTNNQGKLTNASASLNENVGRGHAEKDGKGFFVTDAGRSSLG